MRSAFKWFVTSFLGLLGLIAGFSVAVFFVVSCAIFLSGQGSILKVMPDSEGTIKAYNKTSPLVACLNVKGVIGSSVLSSKVIDDFFITLEKDSLKSRVKAIILMMDSPGGGVFETNKMYTKVKEWKKRNPEVLIYTYVDGLCASGGYYLACATDKIFTSNLSFIGSIGVRSEPFFNVRVALEKMGVNSLILSSGKNKVTLSPFKEWTPEEIKERQSILDVIYNNFIQVVLDARSKVTKEFLIDQGAVLLPSSKALKEGFVDISGVSFEDVLEEVINTTGIKKNYRVIGFDKDSFFRKVVEGAKASPLLTGKMTQEIKFKNLEGLETRVLEKSLPYSYLYSPL